MTDYLNMDALAITVYIITLITLFICLGLIAYVVWGWRKRMRYTTRPLKKIHE
jgi:phage shock protein PspC (stress-responsive transcriptional regulator)